MVWAELCRKAARSTNTRQTRAIFCLATFCGLRNSEICGLRLRDAKLDIPRPVLDVPVGVAKGLRPRQVPLWRLPTALGCLAGLESRTLWPRRRGNGPPGLRPEPLGPGPAPGPTQRSGPVHLRLRGAGTGAAGHADHPLRPAYLRQQGFTYYGIGRP